MTRSIHRLAVHELEVAVKFYANEAGTRVAARFLDEFERVVRLLDWLCGTSVATQHKAAGVSDRRRQRLIHASTKRNTETRMTRPCIHTVAVTQPNVMKIARMVRALVGQAMEQPA